MIAFAPNQPRSRAWVATLCPIVDASPKFERLFCRFVEALDEMQRAALRGSEHDRLAAEVDRAETALIYAFRDLPTGYRSIVVAADRVVWLRLNRDKLPVCVTHGPRSLPLSAAPSRQRRGV